METERPIFVYGTLLPGQPNAYLWARAVLSQEPAVLENGRLYDMGFYPMLVETPGERVKGVALTLNPASYAAVLANLDELEGYNPQNPAQSAYRRECREVVLENGRRLHAWVYVGQPHHINGQMPVAGGDWAAYAAVKSREIADWWSSTTSVHGLH